VPMTPALRTTVEELEQGDTLATRLPQWLRESDKPIVAVVDSGGPYVELVHRLRAGGVPTFRSADQAIRSLGRYLCYREEQLAPKKTPQAAATTKPGADIPLEVHA